MLWKLIPHSTLITLVRSHEIHVNESEIVDNVAILIYLKTFFSLLNSIISIKLGINVLSLITHHMSPHDACMSCLACLLVLCRNLLQWGTWLFGKFIVIWIYDDFTSGLACHSNVESWEKNCKFFLITHRAPCTVCVVYNTMSSTLWLFYVCS